MSIKASIAYMRGPRIPRDVIGETEFNLLGIQYMPEALSYVKAVIPRTCPDSTKQINIVIYHEGD